MRKQKSMNNKGFSLVELIIVIAIMAVLVGVLAPAYISYVEKSKVKTDLTTVSGIMDTCKTLAMDPDYQFTGTKKITVTIGEKKGDYKVVSDIAPADGISVTLEDAFKKIIPAAQLKSTNYTGDTFDVVATVQDDGSLVFTCTDAKFKEKAPELFPS